MEPRRRAKGILRALILALVLSLCSTTVFATVGDTSRAYAATTRDQIAATANAEVGYAASPSQCQKYGPLCDDWCAMFATWVWQQAGVPGAPRSTYVATAIGSWGVDHGLFKRRPAGSRGDPQPGDLAVYGEPGSGTGGHVSVVYSVNANGTITTIDGNYSNRVARRDINPVTQRAGSRNVLISGYVVPPGLAPPVPVTGRVFHNVRRSGGNWTGAALTDGNTNIAQVAEAGMPNGDLHLLTVVGGTLYHRIRWAAGNWTAPALADAGGGITAVAAAGTGLNELHVLTLAGGRVYHRIRSATGDWTAPALADAGGGITAVAAAGTSNGDLHVITLAGGRVYHRIRSATGDWTAPALADNGGGVTAIAAAGAGNGDVHLLTLAGGHVYHNLRFAAGNWSGANLADAGNVDAIAAAGMPNGDLHLVTLAGGNVYHRVRFSAGNWTAPAPADSAGTIIRIAAAGTGTNEMHLATIAP